MMKLRSVIIDDELNNCISLQDNLERYCRDVELVGIAHNAADGLELIQKLKPGLVFLDIMMPGGSGLDMLEAIEHPDFDVIFVTAYDQYAIRAIRKSAIDYLLKPVNILELKDAVCRAVNKHSGSHKSEHLQNYISNQKSPGLQERIALPTSERLLFVKTTDIIRCQGDNNYTNVFLEGGQKILVSKTIKEYEELLTEDGFIRVHQSHLVNARHVRSFERSEGGYLKMSDESMVSVSRQRKEYVLECLKG